MEQTTLAQQLIFNLKALNLNDYDFSSPQHKHDLSRKYPVEPKKMMPSTPSSVSSNNTELKKKRKMQARITPYTSKTSFKARKSLKF